MRKSLREPTGGVRLLLMTTRNAKFLLSLAVELETRIETGDLRGYSVERIRAAAERYRGQAAMGGVL